MSPDDIQRIKQIPLFADLDDALVVAVYEAGKSRCLSPGESVFRQGDPGLELFVVVSGTVRIHHGELELQVLGPGEYFGEMSVIDGSPRSADATVLEAAELFAVGHDAYLNLLSRFKPLLESLLRRLAGAVREGNVHRFGLVQEKSALKEESELERLRSISQMVAGVAHEVNTPLGIIQNAASLAVEALKPDVVKTNEALGDVAEACALIQKNATVASRLVQSFKSLSVRQLTEAREQVDIVATISEALDLYRFKARSSKLKFVMHSDLLARARSYDGYPGYLVQIVLNLVENAQRYAYPDARGGTIEVFVGEAELKTGTPGFEIVVRDFGAGIPEKHLRDVWNPFFTTGRARGGTGLGLAIVHNLVTAALGGTARVESTEGKGTSFILRIPSVAPQAAQGAHA